jgi:hypothetical protein
MGFNLFFLVFRGLIKILETIKFANNCKLCYFLKNQLIIRAENSYLQCFVNYHVKNSDIALCASDQLEDGNCRTMESNQTKTYCQNFCLFLRFQTFSNFQEMIFA